MKTKCNYCKKSLFGIPTNHLICIKQETELNEWRIEKLYRRLYNLEKKREMLLNDEWKTYQYQHSGN
jgi:hypothetical protein